MKRWAPLFVALAVCAGYALADGVGTGGFRPPVGGGVSPNGSAITPSSVTTGFIDAGLAKITQVDFVTGGATKITGNSTVITATAPGGVAISHELTAGSDVWAKGAAGIYVGTTGYPLIGSTDGGQTTGGGSRCEFGGAGLTASAVTITFKNAFGVAPRCACSHIAAVPLACGLTAAASTSQAAFAVATGAGTIDFICCGGAN